MFKFDPKTNTITMTMDITWDDTVSRCWHYYHNASDEECFDKTLHGIEDEGAFPDFYKLTAEEKTAIMQAVADQLAYQEPEGWTAVLNVIDQVVREYIEDTYGTERLNEDDILHGCANWVDYVDMADNLFI